MANRKLQTEIDRTLKKVQEGVELFDEIWDKVYSASNSNQKEKYESDLKKEIKKLQRYRDQIKTWIGSSEVKDKQPLIDIRKAIESQMERFKVCEKEAKTKAYSKEGLNSTKSDPADRKRQELEEWLQDCIDSLSTSVDLVEAEIETLQSKTGGSSGGSGKTKKTGDKQVTDLTTTVERHKWHIGRLELILRKLHNQSINVDQVDEIREAVDYYITSHNEQDFYHDSTLYDDLDLDSPDEIIGNVGGSASTGRGEDGELSDIDLGDDNDNDTDRNEGKEEGDDSRGGEDSANSANSSKDKESSSNKFQSKTTPGSRTLNLPGSAATAATSSGGSNTNSTSSSNNSNVNSSHSSNHTPGIPAGNTNVNGNAAAGSNNPASATQYSNSSNIRRKDPLPQQDTTMRKQTPPVAPSNSLAATSATVPPTTAPPTTTPATTPATNSASATATTAAGSTAAAITTTRATPSALTAAGTATSKISTTATTAGSTAATSSGTATTSSSTANNVTSTSSSSTLGSKAQLPCPGMHVSSSPYLILPVVVPSDRTSS